MKYYTKITTGYNNLNEFVQEQFEDWDNAFAFLCKNTTNINYVSAIIYTDGGQIVTALRTIK